MHYLLLGTALILIYVIFFSSSSFEKKRREIQAKKNKTLVEKIVKSVNKKNKTGATGKNDIPKGINNGGDTSEDIQEGEKPSSASMRNSQHTSPGSSTSSSKPMQNPYLSGSRTTKQEPARENPNQPKPEDSYYPPAPTMKRQKPTSSLDDKNEAKLKAALDPARLFDPGFGLSVQPVERKGARSRGKEPKKMFVAFEGTQAFTLDENKSPVPVPDGYYRIGDTGALIMILGGESYIPH